MTTNEKLQAVNSQLAELLKRQEEMSAKLDVLLDSRPEQLDDDTLIRLEYQEAVANMRNNPRLLREFVQEHAGWLSRRPSDRVKSA